MKHRILIIEDEKPLREAFAFLLESEGFAVALAENGKVGLQKLQAFQPDLVLLDMLMPVMNGQEFLEAAQLPQQASKVRVLMLSNLSDPISIEDAHVYGVTDSVLKADLSPAELAGRVKKLLA
jgi:DNA-binding response OmpR family regulator